MNLFFAVKDKIPAESHFIIQQKLANISDEKLKDFYMLDLKSPTTGLLISWFLGLFGGDRFYKGDIGLGVTKLILGILFMVFFIWASILDEINASEDYDWVYAVFFISCISLFWNIIDLFLVYNGIKKDNLIKIKMIL